MAAPVLSSTIAIMAPRIITNPVDPMVLPKLDCICFNTSLAGMTLKASRRDTMNRAMKAFTFQEEVRTITAIMLTKTSNDKITRFIRLIFGEGDPIFPPTH